MKAILISDHAKWCALMMNGDKTIEVRKGTALYKATKKLIDEYGYAEFYVYCTKGKEKLFQTWTNSGKYTSIKINTPLSHNGKVIFKFRCYKVDKWDIWQEDLEEKLKLTCLSIKEFDDYSKGQVASAIHISNLEIFDKPKELKEFRKKYRSKGYPQNQRGRRHGT